MKYRFHTFILGLSMCLFSVSSCVDQDFDAPPAGGVDPDITPNATIAQLKDMHTLGQYEEITDDLIIEALVISNDEAGNFFRQLIIQDETGGIEMRIDVTDLFNIYPPGRKIFVKCEGLWLGDFNGLVQLGAALIVDEDGDQELQRIPEVLLDEIISKGTFGNVLTPKVKAINELTADDVSTFIQLDGVQFVESDAGLPYADAVNLISVNHEIADCNKQRLILRSSGFSDFASEFTPVGNGTVVGVLGVFGSDLQLLLRDLDDVNMDGERCTIGGGNRLTIQSLREAYAGGAGSAEQGFIQGIVISDFTSSSVTGRNLYIQDETAGIVVRFDANHAFSLNEEIQVEVTGEELSDFNGLVQVNDVPLDNTQSLGAGTSLVPRTATVNDVLTNAGAWESTLVFLENVTLSDNTVFSGAVTVSDGTGSIVLFTRSAADFANLALPTGEVDLTGIVSTFNEPQIVIRNREDVEGGGTGGGLLNENFSSLSDDDDVMLPGWVNVALKGERLWRVQEFSGNKYAQATAFNDTAEEMDTWLITPEIDLATPKVISFETAKAFWDHDGLTVWAATDFDGSDVMGANWTKLDIRIANESDPDHDFIPSGDIDLTAFSGKVRIAFQYVGTGPGGLDTSYRIDNVIVTEQ